MTLKITFFPNRTFFWDCFYYLCARDVMHRRGERGPCDWETDRQTDRVCVWCVWGGGERRERESERERECVERERERARSCKGKNWFHLKLFVPSRNVFSWQTVSDPARQRKLFQHILWIPKCIINTRFTKAICVLKYNICKQSYKSLGLTRVSRRGFWGNGVVHVRVFLIM